MATDPRIVQAYQQYLGRTPSSAELAQREQAAIKYGAPGRPVSVEDQIRDIRNTKEVRPAAVSSGGGGHESGGGGVSSGGGGQKAGEDLIKFKKLDKGIKKALTAPQFNESQFVQRLNTGIDETRLRAEEARKNYLVNQLGSGSMGISGGIIPELKNIGQAESQEIMDNATQLANDEKEFLENQRQVGVSAASQIFQTQLRAITAQSIAEANRAFQAALLEQQMAFAAEQADLDRALQREAFATSIQAAQRGGQGAFASGAIGGLFGGASLGLQLGNTLR